jgi:hypothetical protein
MSPIVVHTVVHTQLHTGSAWGFGWEALVAIGTIGLATFTAWLAWSTRRLVGETEQDVRSEFRPVLIGGTGGGLLITYTAGQPHGQTTVAVKNVGPGPALNITAKLRMTAPKAWKSETRQLGTVGPGQPGSANIDVAVDSLDPNGLSVICEVEFIYEDLAEARHHTILSYDAAPAATSPDRNNIIRVKVPIKETQVRPISSRRRRAWRKGNKQLVDRAKQLPQ